MESLHLRRLASKESFRIATAFFLISKYRLNIILTTGGSMHRVITACIQAVGKVDRILKMMELHVAVSTLHSFRSRNILITCCLRKVLRAASYSRAWALIYLSYIKGKKKKSRANLLTLPLFSFFLPLPPLPVLRFCPSLPFFPPSLLPSLHSSSLFSWFFFSINDSLKNFSNNSFMARLFNMELN